MRSITSANEVVGDRKGVPASQQDRWHIRIVVQTDPLSRCGVHRYATSMPGFSFRSLPHLPLTITEIVTISTNGLLEISTQSEEIVKEAVYQKEDSDVEMRWPPCALRLSADTGRFS